MYAHCTYKIGSSFAFGLLWGFKPAGIAASQNGGQTCVEPRSEQIFWVHGGGSNKRSKGNIDILLTIFFC